MKLVSNYLGLAIVAMSITAFIILMGVSLDYARITHAECGGEYCTVYNHIPVQSYIGLGILVVSAGIGGYITFAESKGEKIQSIQKTKLNSIIKNLAGEERKVFDQVVKNNGSAFQTDLIGATRFSKVKVSRVLDRLEAKGLVERRRRGMSNMIILRV